MKKSEEKIEGREINKTKQVPNFQVFFYFSRLQQQTNKGKSLRICFHCMYQQYLTFFLKNSGTIYVAVVTQEYIFEQLSDKAENNPLKNYADPSASSDNTLLNQLHKGFISPKLFNYYGDKITGGCFDLYLIVLLLFSFLLIF